MPRRWKTFAEIKWWILIPVLTILLPGSWQMWPLFSDSQLRYLDNKYKGLFLTNCLQQNLDLQLFLERTVQGRSPFLSPSLAPLISCRKGGKPRPRYQNEIPDLLNQLQRSDNCLSSDSLPSLSRWKDASFYSIFRGNINIEDIHHLVKISLSSNSVEFFKPFF